MIIWAIAAAAAAAAAAAQAVCELPKGWADISAPKVSVSMPCPSNNICLRDPIGPGDGPFDVELLPVSKVKFSVQPGHSPGPGSYGGVIQIVVPRPGNLDIALSNRAYVDLIRDGAIIPSSAHRMGCGGVRKIVSFAVTPSRYVIQLVDAPEPRVRMLLSQ